MKIPQSAKPSINAFEEFAKNTNNTNARRELQHRMESLEKRNKTWAIILALLASGAVIGGMQYAKSKGINLPTKLIDSAKSAWTRSKKGSARLPNGVSGPLTKKQYNREHQNYLGYKGHGTDYETAFKKKKVHTATVSHPTYNPRINNSRLLARTRLPNGVSGPITKGHHNREMRNHYNAPHIRNTPTAHEKKEYHALGVGLRAHWKNLKNTWASRHNQM